MNLQQIKSIKEFPAPNFAKTDFYKSCKSMKVLFDNDDYHVLINWKCFDIYERSTIKAKTASLKFDEINLSSIGFNELKTCYGKYGGWNRLLHNCVI